MYSTPSQPQDIVEPPLKSYIYQCVICTDGFYADFITGNCLPCNNQLKDVSCKNCAQYSLSTNFTDYLQTYPVLQQSTFLI
jgi:hypothetical protein